MDYDAYWEERAQNKERYQFNPDHMGLERFFSMRYRKAKCLEENIEPGSSVVDLGCGEGAILKFIANRRKIQARGYDISPKAITNLNDLGLEGAVADITDPAFFQTLEPADYVILTDILEHIPKPEDILLNLRGKARKGILLNLPNSGHYIDRLRLLFGRFPQQWIIFPGEHLRFWTLRDFHLWIERMGFCVKKSFPIWGTIGLKDLLPGLFSKTNIFLIKEI